MTSIDAVVGKDPMCKEGQDYVVMPGQEQWCKHSECPYDKRIPVEIAGETLGFCTGYFPELVKGKAYFERVQSLRRR